MEEYKKIIENFFLGYEQKRYHKFIIIFSSCLFIFLANYFIFLKSVWSHQKDLEQDQLFLENALNRLSLIEIQKWQHSLVFNKIIFTPNQLLTHPWHAKKPSWRFFLWPFIHSRYPFLAYFSVWQYRNHDQINFFFLQSVSLKLL